MGQNPFPWASQFNDVISVGNNTNLMTKKDLNQWIMYHLIHHYDRLGFSSERIARYLGMDGRTIRKYLTMSEQDFEQSLISRVKREKTLSSYEDFVKQKLLEFQDTSSSQIHDWLKEHHPDLPDVTSKTVYNFVMHVRQTHNIPIVKPAREYSPVEELPYGEQAQVDFGDYNMRMTDGTRKKVKFFAMVLSRSRMKFIWFLDKPFTAQTVCQAHENAFEFFGGIPKTIVYDQDRTMLVDENLGDVILTTTFKEYTKSRSFILHFCRKSDPESKGKIENVIQYVKKNFLYNRSYYDLEALNTEAVAWLGRTANCLPHNLTKKSPDSEFLIEQEYLKPYTPLTIQNMEHKTYTVRKDNTIAFRSNFYELPRGTYKGAGTLVIVKENDNILSIYNLQEGQICTFPISGLKGQKITNTNHRRDTSKTLDEMIKQTVNYFTQNEQALCFVMKIREVYPRYTRDHLQVLLKVLPTADKLVVDKTLDFCLSNQLFNGHEFEQVLHVHLLENQASVKQNPIKLFNNGNIDKAVQTPQTSNIQDYENIVNQ